MRRSFVWLIAGVIAVGFIAVLGMSVFGYALHSVDDDEIGVKFRSNRIEDIVGPGVYTDMSPFADITDISTAGLPFCAEDPEVLTKDQQRIGLKACGTVFRPGLEGSDTYRRQWSSYKNFYVDNATLIGEVNADGVVISTGLMSELALQAMKVCVGDRNFQDAVVGGARDELRLCIDSEMDELVAPYGLRIDNIVVPNIPLHPTVQALLDQITESRFQTDLAEQEALRAVAEANRRLAEEQGRIKVEQGSVQEQERQRAFTADLERQALEAELQVIVAQKANQLREQELQLQVTEAQLAVAERQARADLAQVFLIAGLYQENPAYLEYLIAQEWASAWGEADKIIVPQGTDPNTIINPDGANVVIPVPGEEAGQ